MATAKPKQKSKDKPLPTAQRSARMNQLAGDFAEVKGEYRLPAAKLKSWLKTLNGVPVAERMTLGSEIIALAVALENQGEPKVAFGVAQLYTCAAVLLQPSAKSKPVGKAKAKAKSSSTGWGAKKK